MNHFPDKYSVGDNELLGLFVFNDNHEAFERIIERHAPMVMHVCRTFLWNPADCEDAVQTVFVLLARKSKSLIRHECIGGWLHHVAVKTSLNRRRSIRRMREVEFEFDVADGQKEPWESIANSQQFEKLHLEISRLPKRYRDVIVLCHLNGMSRSDAAENLDTTTSSIKAALARARKLLRNRLIQQGVGLSTVFAIVESTLPKSCGSQPLNTLAQAIQLKVTTTAHATATGVQSNLFQLVSAKGISAMPVGIIQASLAAALGLVSIGAVSLGLLSGDGAKGTGPSETVVVQQETPEVSEPEPVQVDENATTDETVDLSIAEQMQGLLLQVELQRSEAKSKFGSKHPEVLKLDWLISSMKKFLKEQTIAGETGEEFDFVRQQDYRSNMVIDQRIAQAEIQLQVALQRFGPSHPNVQSLRANVQMWKQFKVHSSATSVDENVSDGNETIMSKLVDLKLQLAKSRTMYADNHPRVQAIHAQVKSLEKFLNIENEKTRVEDDSKTQEMREKLFEFKPTQSGAEFSQPESLDAISVITTESPSGYEATDSRGNTMRRFLDTNRDKKVDLWIYFKNGRETYRDIDRNYNGRADEVQFTTNGDLVRIGKDPDEDRQIVDWEMKRLSDMRK